MPVSIMHPIEIPVDAEVSHKHVKGLQNHFESPYCIRKCSKGLLKTRGTYQMVPVTSIESLKWSLEAEALQVRYTSP